MLLLSIASTLALIRPRTCRLALPYCVTANTASSLRISFHRPPVIVVPLASVLEVKCARDGVRGEVGGGGEGVGAVVGGGKGAGEGY